MRTVIVTHNGPHHLDELLATALGVANGILESRARVYRVPTPEKAAEMAAKFPASNVAVLDIALPQTCAQSFVSDGGLYLDHHESETADRSTCKQMLELCGRVPESVKKLIEYVDLKDRQGVRAITEQYGDAVELLQILERILIGSELPNEFVVEDCIAIRLLVAWIVEQIRIEKWKQIAEEYIELLSEMWVVEGVKILDVREAVEKLKVEHPEIPNHVINAAQSPLIDSQQIHAVININPRGGVSIFRTRHGEDILHLKPEDTLTTFCHPNGFLAVVSSDTPMEQILRYIVDSKI